jgi:hypothetical protein
MRWIFLLLLSAGCLPELGKPSTSFSTAIHFHDISYQIDGQLSVVVRLTNHAQVSNKELAHRLVVLVKPVNEVLSEIETTKHVPVSIKSTSDKKIIELKLKKQVLFGQDYGVFYKPVGEHQWRLVYSFTIKPAAPRLIGHDLGNGDMPLTSVERVIFKLFFDQPMFAQDEQAIYFQDLDGEGAPLNPERITLENGQTALTLRLAKQGTHALIAGKRYGIFFGPGLTNNAGGRVVDKPLEFMAVRDTGHLLVIDPLTISTSGHGIEATRSLSQAHDTEWYIAENDSPFDSFGGLCPIQQSALALYDQEKPLIAHHDRIFFDGLKPTTAYRVLLRTEDYQGRVIVIEQQVTTRKSQDLRISELMINPDMAKGEQERDGEYIEVVNIAESDVRLAGLSITFLDPRTNRSQTCEVVPASSTLVVPKQRYFLIVGQDFLKKKYGLDESALVVHMAKKTVCGGLPNAHKKLIKIHWNDGHFIDRYGGHLWQGPEGKSIHRIALTGLDDEDNYCYSDAAGPTPANVNGPCGK